MAIIHATAKVPGQKVFAVADWNANHTGDATPENHDSTKHVNIFDAIGVTIDGGGAAITTGVKGDIRIPYACTILSATLLANEAGSIVIDVWKDTYANYPPTDADSITAAAPPTIAASNKSEDAALVGWTTAIAAGDTLRFNVDSCATITRVTLILKVAKA